MALSVSELAQAREITSELLDELGLQSYLFEVEPCDEQWELKVDCALDRNGAWESVSLPVPKDMLLASREDAAIHQRIVSAWRNRLVARKQLAQ